MRILGLDVGEKTVGVALSDPLGITAQPLETVRYKDPTDAWARLTEIIGEYDVELIIAGLPLNMNGTEGPQVAKVKKFMVGLTGHLKRLGLSIPHEFRDERLSTVAVERTLLMADLSRQKRKKVIDKLAASFVLQGYLESLHERQ